MSSTSNIHKKYNDTIGIIYKGGNYGHKPTDDIYRTRHSSGYVPWCLDNGVFTGKFDFNFYLGKIDALKEYKSTCLFVVVPDCVGDCEKTISMFRHYRRLIEGFPVAFVSQDGIMNFKKNIPWDDFDYLFVGGTDKHKLGQEGGWIISEARKNKKQIHIGRVNSCKRILKFYMADSWDGTNLSFSPSNVKKISFAVLQARILRNHQQFNLGEI